VNPIERAKVLRAFADEQVMIGMVRHGLGDERRRPHALDGRDAAGAPLRSVHAARVELHHTLCVRQPAVADAGLFRIELGMLTPAISASSTSRAGGHHRKRLLDAGLRAAVAELRAAHVGDHHRLDRPPRDHRRRLAERRTRRDDRCRGHGGNERAPADSCRHRASWFTASRR
jgi:hypothetical protein